MNKFAMILKRFTSSVLVVLMLVAMIGENQYVIYASKTKNNAYYTVDKMQKAALEAIELYKAGKGENSYLDPKFITFRDLDLDGILELYIMDIGGGGDYWGNILKYENGSYNFYKNAYLGKQDADSNDKVYVNKNKEYIFLKTDCATFFSECIISTIIYDVQTCESKEIVYEIYYYDGRDSVYYNVEDKIITKAEYNKIKADALKGYTKVDISYKIVTLTQGKYTENIEEAWNAYKIKSSEKASNGVVQVKSLCQTKPYSTTSITMKWNKCKNATGYEIYRATSKKGTYKKVKTTKATSYKQGKLTRGKTYYYKVRAYKVVNGKKKYGKFSSVKAMGTKPQTPSIKVYAGNKKAKVVWKKISGISGYETYVSKSKTGKYTKVNKSNAKTTEYTKKKLSSGKTYYFKVRSYRTVDGNKIYSSWSQIRSIKVK